MSASKQCHHVYHFFLPHLPQRGSEVSHHPAWRHPDKPPDPRPVAEEMVQCKEHIHSLEVRLAKLGVVEEVEAVSEGILDDGIACICLEHDVHLYGLASNAGLFHPTQYFVRVVSDGGLEPPYTGD